MPLRDRNLVGGFRNAIPKGLHKIDSFIDGKLVESWRWSGDWFGHISHRLRIKYSASYGL